MLSALNGRSITLIKLCIHLSCFIPLFYLYWRAYYDELGADPVEYVIHYTGIGALNIFLLSLVVSPLAKFLKQGKLIQLRRVIGLYAFTYAVFHVLNFLFFEVQFDFSLFISEIFERPYITVGMIGLFILTLLALTSFSRIKRSMGSRWQTLHNFTYIAGIAIVIHFYWSVKSELVEPVIYLVILVLLLVLRKDRFKRWFK